MLLLGPTGARAQDAMAAEDVSSDRPPSGETITFEEAVDLALRRNYRVRQAENDVDLQSIGVARSRMQFFPDLRVSVGGGQSYGRSFSEEEGDIVSQTSESARFGANSSVNLFNGFRDDATLDQAQAQVQQSSRTLQRRRQDVAFDVVSRYIELAQNRAVVGVRRENLELRRRQLEQTQAQIEVGEKPPSDVYQIRADVAGAEQNLLTAQRNAQASENALIQLLVLDPMGDYQFATGLVERLSEEELDAEGYDLDGMLQRAFQQRSDVRARRASIGASKQGVRAARAGFYPRLDLSANYGSNWYSLAQQPVPGTGGAPRTVTITPDDGGGPITLRIPGANPDVEQTPFFSQLDNRRGGSIGLSLSFPLFDRFQTRYDVEQAQVQLQNTRFQLEALRQSVGVEVRQAYLDYQNALEAFRVAEERLQAARKAQAAAQERYRLGAANYVELAQANTDAADAASQRVRAKYDVLLQETRIAYVTGGLNPETPLRR